MIIRDLDFEYCFTCLKSVVLLSMENSPKLLDSDERKHASLVCFPVDYACW